MTSAKRISFLLVVVLTSILASTQFASATEGEKFRVNNDEKQATAIVDSKFFKVNMALGDAGDYSKVKRFDLVVGGCTVSIEGTKAMSQSIRFDAKETGQSKDFVLNPKSVEATGSSVTMFGQDNAGDSKTISLCGSGVTFQKHASENAPKYLVEVKISGEIPPRFELRSEALLYTSTAQKILKGAGLGAIIAAIVIVPLCMSSSIGISIYYGYRKWKGAKEEQPAATPLKNLVGKAKAPRSDEQSKSNTADEEAPVKTAIEKVDETPKEPPVKQKAMLKQEPHPAKHRVKRSSSSKGRRKKSSSSKGRRKKSSSNKGLRKKRSARRNKKIPVEKTVEINLKGSNDTGFDNSRDRETAIGQPKRLKAKKVRPDPAFLQKRSCPTNKNTDEREAVCDMMKQVYLDAESARCKGKKTVKTKSEPSKEAEGKTTKSKEPTTTKTKDTRGSADVDPEAL